jgi:hypothetical protein
VSSALRHVPSARCTIAANDICILLDICGKDIVSVEDTFSIRKSVFIDCMYEYLV